MEHDRLQKEVNEYTRAIQNYIKYDQTEEGERIRKKADND